MINLLLNPQPVIVCFQPRRTLYRGLVVLITGNNAGAVCIMELKHDMTNPQNEKIEWKVCAGCQRFVFLVNRIGLCERCTAGKNPPPPVRFVAMMDEIAPVSPSGKVLKRVSWNRLVKQVNQFYNTIPPQSRMLWNAGVDERRNRAKRPLPKEGFIYLIESENGYFKLGRSIDVDRRLSQHEMDYPLKLRVVHSFASSDVRRDEKRLLRNFRDRQLRGEWFSLELQDVLWFKTIQDHGLNAAFTEYDGRKALIISEAQETAIIPEGPETLKTRIRRLSGQIAKRLLPDKSPR